jgi:hypothetical protein
MQSGTLVVDHLITHRFKLDDATAAYEKVNNDRSALGVILQYDKQPSRSRTITISQASSPTKGKATVGIIGAGNFTKMIMAPSLAKTSVHLAYVADINGAIATHLAKKYKIEKAVSDYKQILEDPAVDAVIIAVGHNLHARFVCETLLAGKHAFVEKPLAMNIEEIKQIQAAIQKRPDRHVMVGFNRRFSPHIVKIKQLLAGRNEPLAMNMTVNAGIIPPEVWVHDPIRGGGRIIGEGCHFIDLLSYLAGSKVQTVASAQMGRGVAVKEDKMSIVLGFEDGSIGTVNYFGNGAKSYPKELLEVFSDGRVLRMDNFRKTEGYGFSGFKKFKTRRQDKGHDAEFATYLNHIVAGGPTLIPWDEIINSTLTSFAAMTSAAEKRTIILEDEYRLE